MDKAELAVRGAASALVDKDQVRRLILVAQSAHKLQADLGLAGADFDEWRKGVLWDTVRKASFRALGQAEFGKALDAFLKLGGKEQSATGNRQAGRWTRTNAAIATRETTAEGDRRRAEFCLRRECENVKEGFGNDEGQALAYAIVLLRQIHRLEKGRELEKATAKQLFATMFTLRNRAAKRIRDAMKAACQ